MELPFCPGCSHELIIKALFGAFALTGVRPQETVIVTDIGCHGIVDRYFGVNTFHGLHGRSFTYAHGIKLAKPWMKVLVLVGDGGCGIGGNHLIHAARRNIGITVIIFNNFNFGMTGGQHSITTPLGGRTTTTPGGNLESPLDVCELVKTSGATFVARTSAFDPQLKEILSKAILHDGFALVDVWELCTAYYMPRNIFKRKQLLERLQGLQSGVIAQWERPEFSKFLRNDLKGYEKGPDLRDYAIQPRFKNNLKGPVQILVAGSAGMKVRFNTSILAKAAILSGAYVTQQNEFPITVLKGYSVSNLIISPIPILQLQIEKPRYTIIASEEGLKRIGNMLPLSQTIFLLESLESRVKHACKNILKFDKVQREYRLLAMFASFVGLTGILDIEALEEAVSSYGYAPEIKAQLEVVRMAKVVL